VAARVVVFSEMKTPHGNVRRCAFREYLFIRSLQSTLRANSSRGAER